MKLTSANKCKKRVRVSDFFIYSETVERVSVKFGDAVV
jgi:hypothetical protein